MVQRYLSKAVAALILAASGGLAQAATMTLTDWRYDNGNTVQVKRLGQTSNVNAGGFEGRLSGAGFGLDTLSLETYCVELTQTISFGHAVGNVTALAAADYFGDALKAERLGRLFSHVFGDGLFGTATDRDALSSALQLAVWNVVYDDDLTLGAGSFSSKGALGAAATALLNNSRQSDITLDLFVLASPTAQDQLTWRARPVTREGEANAVPEPASALLVGGALGLMALARRRRRA